MTVQVNPKGLLVGLGMIVVMIVVIFVFTSNVPSTQIDVGDDQLTVQKGEYTKTVYFEDIVEISFDPDSLLVKDSNNYGRSITTGDLEWDSETFKADFCRIVGHSAWGMNSMVADDMGEEGRTTCVKIIGEYGSDVYIAFNSDPSLITIKTGHNRYLFFNTGSVEETQALYERILELVGPDRIAA